MKIIILKNVYRYLVNSKKCCSTLRDPGALKESMAMVGSDLREKNEGVGVGFV